MLKLKKTHKVILIGLFLFAVVTIGIGQFVKFETDFYCCESPTVRWKFALYCGECDGETGCRFTKIEGSGILEYLELREMDCPVENQKSPDQAAKNNKDTAISNEKKERFYYPGGELKMEFDYDKNGSEYTFKEFYKNGQLKSKGEQGELGGCGIQVGKEYHYTEDGKLAQQRIFNNLLDANESCHDIRTIIQQIDYQPNKKVAKVSWIKTCYECDQYPCGEHKTYNAKGELIRTERFGNCYDAQHD